MRPGCLDEARLEEAVGLHEENRLGVDGAHGEVHGAAVGVALGEAHAAHAELLRDLGGVVVGGVVEHDDLHVLLGEGGGERVAQELALVGGDDGDADLQGARRYCRPMAREQQPSVSLLLPNRNNEHVLELVLERLAAHTTYDRVEVVAVDDGSEDASREILRRWRDSGRFPAFQLLEREHGGAIEALNAGLEAAGGEVIVQLDADASIETPGWVETMLAMLLADERVGVVTAKVVLDSGLIHACGVNLVGPGGLHDRPSRITEREGRRVWHQRVERPREGTTRGGDGGRRGGLGHRLLHGLPARRCAGRGWLRPWLLAGLVRRSRPLPVDPARRQEGLLLPERARAAHGRAPGEPGGGPAEPSQARGGCLAAAGEPGRVGVPGGARGPRAAHGPQ